MARLNSKATDFLVLFYLIQTDFVIQANTEYRIHFYRRNFTDFIQESLSPTTCINMPENSIHVKSIIAFSCWIVYTHPNCISYWSYKFHQNLVKYDTPIIISSYHSCNEREGGTQLNLDITEYFPDKNPQVSSSIIAPQILESYRDVCTCINVPHYIQKLDKWSINNHANEVMAYFQPDCLHTKWNPEKLRAGMDVKTRDITDHTRIDSLTRLVIKIQSFAPNILSPNFQMRCRYSNILKFEKLETFISNEDFIPKLDSSLLNLHGIRSQIDFFSDRNFAGAHLILNLTSDCSELPTNLWLTNEVGSVKADYCVMLYSEHNCFGRSVKVETGRSAVLQETWEQTVSSPNTLALLNSSFQSWHWETRSFHLCNFNEGGPQVSVDITRYFPDKEQRDVAVIEKTYKNVIACQNLPEEVTKLDKWSIDNHGNGLLAYFETNCVSSTFNSIRIPPGRNSFSIGIGSFRGADNLTGIVHKIKSFRPLKLIQATEKYDNTTETLPTANSGINIWLYVGISVGVLFVLICIAIFAVYSLRLKRIQDLVKPEEVRQFLTGYNGKRLNVSRKGIYKDKIIAENVALGKPYDPSIEISKPNCEIVWSSPLGSGEFGCVYKAYITLQGSKEIVEVALKMTKDNCPKDAVLSILREIKILSYLGRHPNLVCIKGAYTAEISRGILYVATEICKLGSIKDYFKNMTKTENSNDSSIQTTILTGPIDFTQMIRWSFEIACGMEYLEKMHVIHADLPARNVLLTGDKTAKISDFGLSRRLYQYTNYVKRKQEPLPWRWMAIESLKKMEFSSHSDVWSYGITLWEIFSMGAIPYPGHSWTMGFLPTLESGLRMSRPTYGTPDIYKLLISCWEIGPQERPKFSQLKHRLAGMLEKEIGNQMSSKIQSELSFYDQII